LNRANVQLENQLTIERLNTAALIIDHMIQQIINKEVRQLWSKKVGSKFGVYKFLVFRELLAHSFNLYIFDYANRDF
jgi:hypothetical protein